MHRRPAGKPRPAGDIPNRGNTECGCAVNEHVSGGACTACPAGELRLAGDDPSGDDTTCSPFIYTKIFDGYHTNYEGGKARIQVGNIDSPAACAQYCHDHSATDIVGFLPGFTRHLLLHTRESS